MLSVSEQVSEEIHKELQDTGLTALSSEHRVSLVGQLWNIAKKEDYTCNIVGESPQSGKK